MPRLGLITLSLFALVAGRDSDSRAAEAPALEHAASRGGTSAERALAGAKLVRSGRYWICPDEVALRRLRSDMPRLERAFFPAQEKFKKLAAKHVLYFDQLEKLREALEQLNTQLSNTSLTPRARQQLENESSQQSDKLKALIKRFSREISGQDGRSPIVAVPQQLTIARNELTLAILATRRHSQQMRTEYARLRGDAALQQAAANTGGEIGPAENNAVLLRDSERLAKAVLTDGVPIYRSNQRALLSLIVAERAPATFEFGGAAGPTLVTATALEAAGVVPDRARPVVAVQRGGRTFQARRVTLPALRFGKLVVRDVEALALPPEAADLGSQLTLEGLGNYRADLNEKRLWFRLVPLP